MIPAPVANHNLQIAALLLGAYAPLVFHFPADCAVSTVSVKMPYLTLYGTRKTASAKRGKS